VIASVKDPALIERILARARHRVSRTGGVSGRAAAQLAAEQNARYALLLAAQKGGSKRPSAASQHAAPTCSIDRRAPAETAGDARAVSCAPRLRQSE
jgi:hypothetical protein